VSVIDFRINNRRLKEVCEELGIRVPYIIVDDDPPTGHENRGATAFPDGVIKLYRRRFELAHRGALAKASNQPLVTPAALLGTCADKARHVLLHELYHCKQYGEGDPEGDREQAEAEAAAFAAENEHRWADLVKLVDK
jgi:hypothetical protein